MTTQAPVFGPNDFNMASGDLRPGLGDAEEQKIRRMRGGVFFEEPPDKAALRKQADDLKAKTRQLSTVERELEKERTLHLEAVAAKEAELAEREALLNAQLKALEDSSAPRR